METFKRRSESKARPKVTKEALQYIMENAKDKSKEEMAEELGVGKNTIGAWTARLKNEMKKAGMDYSNIFPRKTTKGESVYLNFIKDIQGQ